MESLESTIPDQKSETSMALPMPEYVLELVSKAQRATRRLASLPTSTKNHALLAMAEALEAKSDELLTANERDLAAFGTAPEKKAMADR